MVRRCREGSTGGGGKVKKWRQKVVDSEERASVIGRSRLSDGGRAEE